MNNSCKKWAKVKVHEKISTSLEKKLCGVCYPCSRAVRSDSLAMQGELEFSSCVSSLCGYLMHKRSNGCSFFLVSGENSHVFASKVDHLRVSSILRVGIKCSE